MADLFAPHLHVSRLAVRDRSQKTAETLLLEPSKNKEKRLPQARQTFTQRKTWKPASHQAKLKKKVFGTRMRKGRTPAGFVPKPLRNRSRKNAETSLLEPTKKKEKNICPNHAKPQPENCRNVAFGTYEKCRKEKNAETLLLEPPKKKKRLPQARQTFAQRKTWKPASHQTKLKKKVFRTRMRKGRTPAGFVPKPLPNRSRKNAETSLLEPIKKKEIAPKPCETAARKLPKRCFWNLLKTKKKPASHQAKLKKKVFGTRMRKSRTPAGFVPKPLRNRSQKNAETSLLEPTKKKEV